MPLCIPWQTDNDGKLVVTQSEQLTKGGKYKWVPFGAGRHRCIGFEFAQVGGATRLWAARQSPYPALPCLSYLAVKNVGPWSSPPVLPVASHTRGVRCFLSRSSL